MLRSSSRGSPTHSMCTAFHSQKQIKSWILPAYSRVLCRRRLRRASTKIHCVTYRLRPGLSRKNRNGAFSKSSTYPQIGVRYQFSTKLRSVRNLLAPNSAGTSARRADGRMGLRGGGLRRAMGVGRPEAEAAEDLPDDLGLVNGRALIEEPESQRIAKVTRVATPH